MPPPAQGGGGSKLEAPLSFWEQGWDPNICDIAIANEAMHFVKVRGGGGERSSQSPVRAASQMSPLVAQLAKSVRATLRPFHGATWRSHLHWQDTIKPMPGQASVSTEKIMPQRLAGLCSWPQSQVKHVFKTKTDNAEKHSSDLAEGLLTRTNCRLRNAPATLCGHVDL